MLEKVFENFKKEYDHILGSFYPSLGSTGFQERNLTTNFAKAYEKTFDKDDVIVWFELQFGEENNNHFECLIINKTKRQIILIESKRFVSAESKKSSVEKDIKRINDYIKNDYKTDDRFKKYRKYDVYGLILADIWKESDPKKQIFKDFKNKRIFGSGDYFAVDFKIKKCKAKYALLAYMWNTKNSQA